MYFIYILILRAKLHFYSFNFKHNHLTILIQKILFLNKLHIARLYKILQCAWKFNDIIWLIVSGHLFHLYCLSLAFRCRCPRCKRKRERFQCTTSGSRLPPIIQQDSPTQNAGASARCTRIGKLIVEIRGSSITALTQLYVLFFLCSVRTMQI